MPAGRSVYAVPACLDEYHRVGPLVKVYPAVDIVGLLADVAIQPVRIDIVVGQGFHHLQSSVP